MEFFRSPRILVSGAKESATQFESRLEAWGQNCLQHPVTSYDTKTGDELRGVRVVFPDNLLLPAHRVVTELRHALDQATSDAALATGLAKIGHIHFPLGKDIADYEAVEKKRLKGVHPDIVAFIRMLKPYYGGNSELWALGRIAGPNKHQRILSAEIHFGGLLIDGSPFVIRAVEFTQGEWNSAQDELYFARIQKGGEFKGNPRLSLVVVIGEAEVIGGQEAVAVFHNLIGIVERIIDGLEAETLRVVSTMN